MNDIKYCYIHSDTWFKFETSNINKHEAYESLETAVTAATEV